jgi:hypothetical protein
MNCKNCGAPLTGRKCDYCGTEKDAPEYRSRMIQTADCIIVECAPISTPVCTEYMGRLAERGRLAGEYT